MSFKELKGKTSKFIKKTNSIISTGIGYNLMKRYSTRSKPDEMVKIVKNFHLKAVLM